MKSFLKPTPLFEKKAGEMICLACRRFCSVKEGESGFCGVRFNFSNILYAPWGYLAATGIDPIEKKPMYHFLPGETTFSFSVFGCNFRCLYCQNYGISQKNFFAEKKFFPLEAEDVVHMARQNKAKILVSTYGEPTISAEWTQEIFKLAQKNDKNIKTGIVSNGYFSLKTLDFLEGVDFVKIDLKSFNEKKFSNLTQASLKGVLESIKEVHNRNIWLEIVTLLIPGFNDSEEEILKMAEFIASLSLDIPWHITAFKRNYKMQSFSDASLEDIEKAVELGRSCGLRYVYGGNVADKRLGQTCCYACGKILIERRHLMTVNNVIDKGFCPYCKTQIKGVWE